MGAAVAYRRSSAGAAKALVQQFVYPDRVDIIKYAPNYQDDGYGWYRYTNAGSPPFRNGNPVAVPGGYTAGNLEYTFRFISGGRVDEWFSLHGLTSSHGWQVFVNGQLAGYRDTQSQYVATNSRVLVMEGGYFWGGGDLYQRPFFKMQPYPGVNVVRFVRVAGTDSCFLDGVGLNVRGGPLPV